MWPRFDASEAERISTIVSNIVGAQINQVSVWLRIMLQVSDKLHFGLLIKMSLRSEIIKMLQSFRNS